MLFVNPQLLVEQLNEHFYFLINLQSSNMMKIINGDQFQLLQRIIEFQKDNREFNSESDECSNFLRQLKELDFVGDSETFSKKLSRRNLKSINLWVHTTDLCNLNCNYCYIRTKKFKTSINHETRLQIKEKIFETVSNNKIQTVILRLAGGEPLIVFEQWRDFLIELKEGLSNLNCILKPVYLTNLTLFPSDFVDFIKLIDAKVSVSIDGVNKYHDATRKFNNKDGSFLVVKENLLNLIKNGIKPSIMTVVSNENMDGIFEFCQWIVELRLPFRFSIAHDVPFDFSKAYNVFVKCYNYIELKIKEGYPFSSLHRICDLKFEYFSDKNCGCGLNSGTIYSDGNIYYCQKLLGSGKSIDNIFTKSDLLSKIREQSHDDELIDECNLCHYRYICNGGCPLSRIDGKSAACELYKKLIPIIYRLIGLEKLYLILNTAAGKHNLNVN